MTYKTGYPLPETVPETFRCLRVFVPDCPEGLLALKGSLFYLCKWLAWERTGDGRALQMGQQFLKAFGLSFSDCEDCMSCPTIEEIRAVIQQEINNMPINIYNGCGCGCGCGGGTMTPPTEDQLPPGANPPEPTAGNPDNNDWLCLAAHDVCARYIQFWEQVNTYSTNITTDVLAAILDGLLIFYAIGGVFASLLTVIGQYLTAGLAQQEIALFTALCPAIISAIRTSADAASAKAAVLNIIWSSSYPYHQRLAAYYLAASGNWDMVFTVDSWDAPANEECDDIPSPDTCWLPAGYESQRAQTILTHTASPQTVTVTLTANAGSDDCGSFSEFALTGLLDEQNETWRHVMKTLFMTEATEAIGYYIEVLQNEAIGGNSPAAPITRLGFDNDHDENIEGSVDAYAPYIFVCVKSAHMAAFAPLVGTVVQELQQIMDNDWDFDTQYAYFDCYKRSGVSNNVFGPASFGGRFRYIRTV